MPLIKNLLLSLIIILSIKTNNIKNADLIVLNTCHIREKAAEKVYSDIGRINKIKNNKEINNNFKLIVSGCVAQAEGEEIKNLEALANPDSLKQFKDIKELNE